MVKVSEVYKRDIAVMGGRVLQDIDILPNDHIVKITQDLIDSADPEFFTRTDNNCCLGESVYHLVVYFPMPNDFYIGLRKPGSN